MGKALQTLPEISSPPQSNETQEFTCQICIEPMLNPNKRFENANRCSHGFCTDCMVQYIRVKLEQNEVVVGNIPCPAINCSHMLDHFACAPLIGDALFVRWCDALCQSAVLGLDKCYCPSRNCNVLILNECGGKPKKSLCPKCKRWFCFQCKRDWHAGFACSESGEPRDANDMAFGRLVEQGKWARCPACRHVVERTGGCNTITCRCGNKFCYKCGKKLTEALCRSCDKDFISCVNWCSCICCILLVIGFMTCYFL